MTERVASRYRVWLYAAAAYNLCWGTGAIVLANQSGWKAAGVVVFAYAPAYWWAARFPERHAHLVAVALLGKSLGIIGFTAGAALGRLPLALGLVVLTNDLIWWPAFARFVVAAARAAGGWRAFLVG